MTLRNPASLTMCALRGQITLGIAAAALLAVSAHPAAAFVISDEPVPAAPAPGTGPVTQGDTGESPLSGPRINDRAANGASGKPATLIEREFDGRIRRLERDPAIAALEVLDLDAASREKADQIIVERQAMLDAVVQDNLKSIVLVAQAFESNSPGEGLRQLAPLIKKTEPLRKRGRLVEELAAVLPAAKADELRRLHREYWNATVQERMTIGNPREPGKKLNRIQASATEMLMALGQDVKSSYERVFGQAGDQFERLLAKLQLTPEQDSKIRRIFTDNFTKSYGKPSQAESTKAFLEAYGLLDATQRRILMEQVHQESGVRRGRGSAAPGAGGGATSKPVPTEIPAPAEIDGDVDAADAAAEADGMSGG